MRGWMKESLWLVAIVVVLAAGAVLAFFELPSLVVTPDDLRETIVPPAGAEPPSAPSAADLVQARNGVRTAGVALIAGIGAAFATGFAGRTFYLSRRGQLDERCAAAAEQLRTTSEPAVQVSAIHRLDRLARESPEHHGEVMGILATFLRSHERPGEEQSESAAAPAAVQAAFSVLVRRRRRNDRGLVIDLAQADLRQIQSDRAQLQGVNLSDAKLGGAFLRYSDLRRANLKNARASSARFEHAKLDRAILEGAQLDYATLDFAKARRATFGSVEFNETSLDGADLRRAIDLPRTEDGGVEGATITRKTRLPR